MTHTAYLLAMNSSAWKGSFFKQPAFAATQINVDTVIGVENRTSGVEERVYFKMKGYQV